MTLSFNRVLTWLSVCLISLTACVTINIYFPAAAAEKAADKIIREVWQEQQPDAEKPPTPEPKQGRLDNESERHWGQLALDFLITPAQAKADITINTPAINQLKNAMASRHRQLAPYYDSGAVGLTRDGFLAVRDLNAVPLKSRNTVNSLVSQDNNDRRALYREIAKANGHPEWENDIRATFARQWISNARSGWWYQSGSGWAQK